MEKTRVKINLNTGEIEFEGSEEFVQNQIDNLETVINIISSSTSLVTENLEPNSFNAVNSEEPEENKTNDTCGALTVPDSFGEWMHKLRDNINDMEKALVTAYFVQNQSPKNDFKTLEVNKSLKDHGMKLSNPSHSLKQLESKKYLFQTRKDGPKIRFMRVSQDGINHLKSLLR